MKKTKRLSIKTEQQEQTFATLKKFKLKVDDEVRFRINENHNWTKGIIKGENPDKSITIWDGNKIRCIMPENIQLKTKGPRGGVTWKEVKK